MKRIAIALVTLIGFTGAAFAEPTLNTAFGPDAARASYSKVESTSYVAQWTGADANQPFNP